MEKLTERKQALEKALQTLEKSLKRLECKEYNDYEEIRDSIIQRFEYCTDIFWKCLKDYLQAIKSITIEPARPKIIFKECYESMVISKDEHMLCIALIEDRNLTSHSYNEALAEEIIALIPRYFALMKLITHRLSVS